VNFLAELRRRNVIRMAGLHVVIVERVMTTESHAPRVCGTPAAPPTV